MLSRAKAKDRSDTRYRLLEVIGEGGMGVVWKAFDSRLNTHVAVKTLLDSFDRDAFERFQDECQKLAGLPHHPNITRIMDVGEIEQDGRQKPFFVMPLLEGATLAELLNPKSMKPGRLQLLLAKKTAMAAFLAAADERLPAPRIVEIICQVCKGLQVAHDNGIIHRDIKPSNIFVLSDFSIQIIDFGVARRTDGESGTVGWKGTLPYMSPEQVQFRPLTTASDIFSLGVVCYEALVGQRPFLGNNNTEIAEAIVGHTPKVPHEAAPVKIAISQAVFKALAKQSDNRYLTAMEFGDHLSRALTLGDADLFPLPRPRLALAADYHAKGNDEAAAKLLETLHVEGISHPEISQLREQVDRSLRKKRIEEGIAASRSLMEVHEYDQANRSLKQVLAEDSGNAAAVALLKEIETRRTDADVEELLRQTRRQMDEYDFTAARHTLDKIRKRRPKDPRLNQFSIELDRIQEEYEQLQKERHRLFDAVQSAFERRDISSARSIVRKLAALDELHPDVPNPKQAEILSIRTQVDAEQDAIDAALADVHRLTETNRLVEALEVCSAQLARYPANEHFLHLQFQIEELQRQVIADAIRETDALLRAEPDLLNQEKLLRSRTEQHPGESYFSQRLESTRKLKLAVDEIVSRARTYEGEKGFQEALQEWQKLSAIYPRYPGLQAELDRITARRSEQERRQRKEKLTQQIHREIDRKEFQAAYATLAGASNEFPNDLELAALDTLIRGALKTREEAQTLLRKGVELCGAAEYAEGLDALRKAYGLDRDTAAVAGGLVECLLAYAMSVQDSDPAAAEAGLREALAVEPEHVGAKDRLSLLLEKRHDELVTACIADSLHREGDGDLFGALQVIEPGLRDFPGDERLTSREASLRKKLGTAAPPARIEPAVGSIATTIEVSGAAIKPKDGAGTSPGRDTRSAETWFKTLEDEEPVNRGDGSPPEVTVAPKPEPDAPPARQRSSRKFLWWSLAGGVTVAVIVAAFLYQPNPKAENALATARVQSSSSPLLSEPRGTAANLMTLYRGQQVNVLERIRANQPFIRVQFVSSKRNSRPGYVRRADLGEWNNGQFVWDVIMLGSPAEGASATDRDKFAEALIRFGGGFPNSAHADGAYLQAAQLYLDLAAESDKAGATEQRDEYLRKAEEALDRVSEREKDEVAALRKRIADMRQPEAAPPPEADPRLPGMYNQAARCWVLGDVDCTKELVNEMLKIDSNYDGARRLQRQIYDAEHPKGR